MPAHFILGRITRDTKLRRKMRIQGFFPILAQYQRLTPITGQWEQQRANRDMGERTETSLDAGLARAEVLERTAEVGKDIYIYIYSLPSTKILT